MSKVLTVGMKYGKTTEGGKLRYDAARGEGINGVVYLPREAFEGEEIPNKVMVMIEVEEGTPAIKKERGPGAPTEES